MIGTQANALGYASTAILVALIKDLVASKVITKDQASRILDEAQRLISSGGSGAGADAAVRLIADYVKPRIAA